MLVEWVTRCDLLQRSKYLPQFIDFSKHVSYASACHRLAHPNRNGLPYASSVNFSHSSDLRTMQEVLHVKATGGSSPFLGNAANANDRSDLFAPGVIPTKP